MSLDIEPLTSSVYLGAMTAASSTELPVFVADTRCVVLSVDLVTAASVTGHTQNYGIGTVRNRGASGTGTTVVAQRATSSTGDSITAFSAWPVTTSTTASAREISPGDTLTFQWSQAGTGPNLTGACVVIHYAVGTGNGI